MAPVGGQRRKVVTVIFADGTQTEIPRASKTAVADRIWSLLVPRLAARPTGRAPTRKTRASRIPT